MSAALVAICASDDLAAAAYLFNGERPTVIRILAEEEKYGGGYLLIIEDDGLSVNRKHFRRIDELEVLLTPESDDHTTYCEAVLKVLDSFRVIATNGC